MFLGRDRELAELNRLYAQERFQCFVLYGRRRVGKTTLLNAFCRDKDAIFFSAEVSNDKRNLDKFSQVVQAHYGEIDMAPFASWVNAWSHIVAQQQGRPLVLVLDEFPYLADKNPEVLSNLQHFIDHHLQDSRIFLILCGSYVGFMEREVLGQKSPLFGRRTGQLLLKPLDYLRSRLFLPGFTPEEQLMLYGAVGGTPLYLSRIDNTRSLHDNIVDVFLRPVSYFYDEPLFLLREELQEPSVYNAILEAIARGASRANEIATRIGEPPAKCLKYIKTLRDLDIVYKETPLGERETSRRTLYGIADQLFRFWYRYVFGNKTLLETNAWEVVWQRIIQPDYPTYMGLVFEQVCRSYLLQQNAQGQLPLLITQLGRWWGTDSHTHQQVEIDLAGTGGTQYLFAECKWRNEPMPMSVLETLKHRADIYRRQRGETWWYLFSKSGFTAALQKAAAVDEHVVLCDLVEIMQI